MAVVVGLQAPIFPYLVGGKNFNGKLKKVGLKKSGYAFGAILIHRPSA